MTESPCVQCGTADYRTVLETNLPVAQQSQQFLLLECLACGLVKTAPRLSAEELSAFYSPEYYGRVRPDDLDWVRHDQRYKVRFLETFLAEGRVLDVGCGLGIFLLALDPARWDRHGLEAMPTPHEKAVRQLGAERIQQAELEEAGWPARHFDALTFWDVIEHVPNPRRTLEAAFRLLRPGGVLLLTTPNFNSYLARRFGADWYSLSLPHHLYHYTPATLTRLLETAGFRVRSLEDRFAQENYHSCKHSFLNRFTRRYGKTAGRVPYYLLKPFFHPWEWISAKLDGGCHLAVCAERPAADTQISAEKP